jgi:hypothetical protein
VETSVVTRPLHEYGLYYGDSLIETHFNAIRFCETQHADATIYKAADAERILEISHIVYVDVPFHGDFNMRTAGEPKSNNMDGSIA